MISYFESEINKVLKHIPSNTTQLNEQYFCDSNRKIYLIGRNEQAKELIGKITINGIIDDFTQDVIWSGISIYKLSDINDPSIFVNCSTSISSYDVYEKIKTLNSLHKVFNVYDLIDIKGKSKYTGKMVNKDKKKGKSTIINLVGYNYAHDYAINLKKKILRNLKKHGKKANDLKDIINFILERKY